jgi:S-adenosylmethionine decarboxylase
MIYSTQGSHYICDFWDCPTELLNNGSYLMEILRQSAKLAHMTILGEQSYQFQPQGFTGILLLSESHLSIHTYPESNYCAIDIYTCGKSDSQLAIDYLKEMLNPQTINEQNIVRGFLKGR